MLELSGFEARNEGWLAATTRLTAIQVSVETGLELSILAHDDANRQPGMLGEAERSASTRELAASA